MKTENKIKLNNLFNDLEDKTYQLREIKSDCYDEGNEEEATELYDIIVSIEERIEDLRTFLDKIGANNILDLEKELGLIND